MLRVLVMVDSMATKSWAGFDWCASREPVKRRTFSSSAAKSVELILRKELSKEILDMKQGKERNVRTKSFMGGG